MVNLVMDRVNEIMTEFGYTREEAQRAMNLLSLAEEWERANDHKHVKEDMTKFEEDKL